MPIHQIIEEILATPMEENDIAYVSANGTWTLGLAGCQPSHTFAIGDDELEDLGELVSNLESWFDYYDEMRKNGN